MLLGHIAQRCAADLAQPQREVRTALVCSGASKQATLETGLFVRIPLFFKEGEEVRVNTQTGEVAGRA